MAGERTIIHIHVDNSSRQETHVIHEQRIGDQIEIRDSEIRQMIVGEAGVGDPAPPNHIEQANEHQVQADSVVETHTIPSSCANTELGKDIKSVPTSNVSSSSLPRTEVSTAVRYKASILNEKARLLAAQKDYEGAISCLEDPSISASKDFSPLLTLGECYIRHDKIMKAAKTTERIYELLMDSSLDPSYVVDHALICIQLEHFISAVILYRAASLMYKLTSEEAVRNIYFCVSLAGKAVKNIIDSDEPYREVAIKYGTECMTDMVDDLRKVEGVDPKTKAIKEAGCLEWIGVCFCQANDPVNSAKFRLKIIKILDKTFGTDASRYKVYGVSLHNIAFAYNKLKNYTESKQYYLKAIEAKQYATDYLSADLRQKSIEMSGKRLNEVGDSP